MSDPELKAQLARLITKYAQTRKALRRVQRIINAPRPINTAARMAEIQQTVVEALKR